MSTYSNFTTTLICIALLSHSCTSSLKTDDISICELPPSRGYCKGKGTTRYFYNINTHTCETFTYSRCGGNYNNFEDFQSCKEFSNNICDKASYTTSQPIPTNTCCKCMTPTPLISGCLHDITCQNIICNSDEACCNNTVGWDQLCSSDAENICLQTMNEHTPNRNVNPTSFPTSYPIINEILTTSEGNKPSSLPTANPTVYHMVQPTESILITDTVSTTDSKITTSAETKVPTVSNTFSTFSATSDMIFTTTENSQLTLFPSTNPIVSTTVQPTEITESSASTNDITQNTEYISTTDKMTTVPTTTLTMSQTTYSTIEHSTTSDMIFVTSESNKLTTTQQTESIVPTTFTTDNTESESTTGITINDIHATDVGISTTEEFTISTSRLITIANPINSISFTPLLPDDIETPAPTLIIDINEGTTNSTLESTIESTNSDTEKGMDDIKQQFSMESIDRTKGGTIAVCIIGGIFCVFFVIIVLHYTKFRSNEKKKRAMQDFDLEQNGELKDLRFLGQVSNKIENSD